MMSERGKITWLGKRLEAFQFEGPIAYVKIADLCSAFGLDLSVQILRMETESYFQRLTRQGENHMSKRTIAFLRIDALPNFFLGLDPHSISDKNDRKRVSGFIEKSKRALAAYWGIILPG
jgi:hypothetical protein